jgi:hypothetical protein
LADRLFSNYALWQKALTTGSHLLWRVKKSQILPDEQRLAEDSDRSAIYPDDKARRPPNWRRSTTSAGQSRPHSTSSKRICAARASCLRSKTPDLVRQQFHGLMLAYFFTVRRLIHDAALQAGQDPDRPSFVHAIRVIRRKLPLAAAIPPEQRPLWWAALLQELLAVPATQSRGRRNPRAVKRKMSAWPIRPRVGVHYMSA